MLSSRKVMSLSIITAGILLMGTIAYPATYTVSPGESIGTKMKGLRPGDTLLIKEGIYPGSIWVNWNLKGTKEEPILIKAEKGTVIKPTDKDGILFWQGDSCYVIIEGLRIEGASRAGILVNGAHHITIRNCVLGRNGAWGVQTTLADYITVENCELYGSGREHGVYFATTDHPVARNNIIHDNRGCGVHMNGDRHEGGDGMITGGLIENNIIYNCGRGGGGGINMDGVEYSIIRNNLLYNNKAGGITHYRIDAAHMGEAVEIYNNTIYFKPNEGRWCLIVRAGAKNTVIKNNIFYGGKYSTMGVEKGGREGLVSDYNIFYTHPGQNLIGDADEGIRYTFKDWQKESSQDAHSFVADPVFCNPAEGDFHLKKESPAIGAGIPLYWTTFDLEGKERTKPAPGSKRRPAFDFGAYQHYYEQRHDILRGHALQGDANLRDVAINCLIAINDPEAGNALAEVILGVEDLLAEFSNPGKERLPELLQIVEIMGKGKGKSVTKALAQCLKSQDPSLRYAGVRSLGQAADDNEELKKLFAPFVSSGSDQKILTEIMKIFTQRKIDFSELIKPEETKDKNGGDDLVIPEDIFP